MPKSHRPYPPEYREPMMELVRSGRSPESLAREFEPVSTIARRIIELPEVHVLPKAARPPEPRRGAVSLMSS